MESDATFLIPEGYQSGRYKDSCLLIEFYVLYKYMFFLKRWGWEKFNSPDEDKKLQDEFESKRGNLSGNCIFALVEVSQRSETESA